MPTPAWWSRVKGVMDGRGIPVKVWLPILWAESSGNPNARNLGSPGHPEDSVGLFALNRAGGQGTGMSVSYLQDPVNNASIAANSFAVANAICARQGNANDLTCIALHSGHPTETGNLPPGNQLIANIRAAAQALGDPSSDDQAWSNVSHAQPGDPSQPVPPGTSTSTWSDWLTQIGDAIKGEASGAGQAVSDAQEKTVWNVILGVSGVALVWLGLAGLTAPAVKIAANVAAPIVPAARGAAIAADIIGGTSKALGTATVKTIDTIAPKAAGRQAIRVKPRR